MAIQLIIDKEWGLATNENPLQGSFVVDELTDLVEEAVLAEFDRIAERGGVLGAMETGYQRGPDPGRVDALRAPQARRVAADRRGEHLRPPESTPRRRRSSWPGRRSRRSSRSSTGSHDFHARHATEAAAALRRSAGRGDRRGNVFDELMRAARVCSLGQLTGAFFEVGGQYRRNV